MSDILEDILHLDNLPSRQREVVHGIEAMNQVIARAGDEIELLRKLAYDLATGIEIHLEGHTKRVPELSVPLKRYLDYRKRPALIP